MGTKRRLLTQAISYELWGHEAFGFYLNHWQ